MTVEQILQADPKSLTTSQLMQLADIRFYYTARGQSRRKEHSMMTCMSMGGMYVWESTVIVVDSSIALSSFTARLPDGSTRTVDPEDNFSGRLHEPTRRPQDLDSYDASTVLYHYRELMRRVHPTVFFDFLSEEERAVMVDSGRATMNAFYGTVQS
jgi:hypothetical protein